MKVIRSKEIKEDISESQKLNKEFKAGDIIQIDWQEKIDDIKNVFRALTEARELRENRREMNQNL